MKRSLVPGLMLGIGLLVGCTPGPDFVDLSGTEHRYSDVRDKWIVINYWATWCAPCIKEIPELNTLAEMHADTLVVYGVNWDDPALEEAIAQAQRMKIEFPVYSSDPSAALGIDKPEVLPATYLVAPSRKAGVTTIAAELKGPQTVESILAAIRAAQSETGDITES